MGLLEKLRGKPDAGRLDSADAVERYEAAKLLGDSGDPGAVAPLVHAYRAEQDANVRLIMYGAMLSLALGLNQRIQRVMRGEEGRTPGLKEAYEELQAVIAQAPENKR